MNLRELIEKLKSGEIAQKDLENLASAEEARKARLQYLQETSGLDLSEFSEIGLDPERLKNKNIENLVGSTEVPLGLAGPLKVSGDFAGGEYFVPLATTEGALVASTARGCKVITQSGGVETVLDYPGITRAPLLKTTGIRQTREIVDWVNESFEHLREVAAKTSGHLELLKVDTRFLGQNLWLRMNFDTSEAMGMNMATKAARAIVDEILREFSDVEMLAISGNYCADKKPTFVNTFYGRGRNVHAQVKISRSVVEEVLKVTPEKIVDVNLRKVWQGSVMAGATSFNSHFANIVSAVFLATGQDLAHVVNSSQGYVSFSVEDGDLYGALNLPAIIVGTIGGGTGLPRQRAALELMLKDISGSRSNDKGNSETEGESKGKLERRESDVQVNKFTKDKKIAKPAHRFAEILAGVVMAGELSLHAAIAAGHLVSAHQKLGKGKV